MMLKDLFTGKDNQTIDIGRVAFAVVLIGYLSLIVYFAIAKNQFDAKEVGLSLAAILTAGGACLGLKSRTEPDIIQYNGQIRDKF